MKGFEVAQGRRGRDIPSGLGPSLGPIIHRVPGPCQEGGGQYGGTCHFTNDLNPPKI